MMKSHRMEKINILLTAIVICISVVLVGLVYFPRLVGLKEFSIETGSMEPTVKQGSMVFVRRYDDFTDYSVGDIVTFSDVNNTKSFTHRIVEINESDQSFDTKGDANDSNDPSPTNFQYAYGKVEFVIPYVGYAVTFLKNTPVKIAVAAIYIAWIAIEVEVFVTERKKRYD
jgi:signal peptidase